MNPELSKTLAELAQKLGTSIEHLWPVLVAHARISAVTDAVGCMLVLGISICAIFKGARMFKFGVSKEALRNDQEWNAVVGCLIAVISTVMAFGMVIGIINDIPNAIYPEAAAINHLLGGNK